MDPFGTFLPINTGDLCPPETIIIPVLGIIAAVLIGKFGGRVLKYSDKLVEKAKNRYHKLMVTHSL